MGESSSRGAGVWSEEELSVVLHNLGSIFVLGPSHPRGEPRQPGEVIGY